jgi:hypothetical protein
MVFGQFDDGFDGESRIEKRVVAVEVEGDGVRDA